MTDTFAIEIPDDALELSDVAFAWRMGAPDGLVVTARTRVLRYRSAVMFSRIRDRDDRPGLAIGLRPEAWSIAEALPALSHPALDSLALNNVALVVTDRDARVPSTELSEAAYQFYHEVYQSDAFDLVLTPGLNLVASWPIQAMSAEDPLKGLFDRLGFQSGVVILQGTLGRSLAAAGSGAGTLDLIRDVYLRASLPKMRLKQSPAWFKSGQLSLEITGHPSVGFVGEITVDIDGDVMTFSVAAKIEKDGRGAAVALVGGLTAEEPWVHPFDLAWLTFYRLVLKLSVDTQGNIGLGFAGKMIIGEKDMDVAIAIEVSPAGTPTNFLFDGETVEGVSMADLVAVQAGMRAAKGALPGAPPPPPIPLDRLPDMEIKDVHLTFALKDDPDLQVERGLALKGELWVQMRPGAAMTNFAGCDFSIDDSGIVAKAHLAAYAIGPVSWDDALLDVELTMARQNVVVRGSADVAGLARQDIDVSITREGAFFTTEAELAGRFRGKLDADAPFTIRDPVWQIRGEMDNEFNGVLTDLALARLREWADDHEQAIAAARQASEAAAERAATAAEHVERLDASAAEGEAAARQAMESAARAREAAEKAVARAEAALGQAQADLEGTPARHVKVRAERRATVAKARADLAARQAAREARQADHAAKQAAYEALSSDAVQAARDAAREADAAARAAESRLEEMEALVADVRAGGSTPIVVDRSRFEGRLDTMAGGTVHFMLDMRVRDRPRTIAMDLDFHQLEDGAAQLVNSVLSR